MRAKQYRTLAATAVGLITLLAIPAVATAAAPPIRTSVGNPVPACVSPARLMEFLRSQNPKVDPMYDGIAKLYKEHGSKFSVRWDYAFFQMAIETGYLAFRRPGGKAGDVKVRQYNFAGIGTTGGGVPGDSYPDVSTGVLAQIQHLVAYSGEHVDNPIAPRTRLMQSTIIDVSQKLKRPVTFADLSGRWAADKSYGVTIEKIAERFRVGHCQGPVQSQGQSQGQGQGQSQSPPEPRHQTAQAAQTGTGAVPGPRAVAAIPGTSIGAAAAPLTAPVASKATVAIAKVMIEKVATIRPQIVAAAPAAASPVPAVPAPTGRPAQIAAAGLEPSRPVLVIGPALAARPPARPQAELQPPLPESVPEPVTVASAVTTQVADASGRSAANQRVGSFASRKLPDSFGGRTSLGASGVVPPASQDCRIATASYGGNKTLLLKSVAANATIYTLLQVVDGFETPMRDRFIASRAPGAEMLGEFASQDIAMVTAKALCAPK
jgi:hypothetical protein